MVNIVTLAIFSIVAFALEVKYISIFIALFSNHTVNRNIIIPVFYAELSRDYLIWRSNSHHTIGICG